VFLRGNYVLRGSRLIVFFLLFLGSALFGQSGTGDNRPSPSAQAASDTASQHPAEKSDPDQDHDYLPPGEDPQNQLVIPFVKHIGQDQAQFWSTPAHFNVKSLKWAIPFVGITAGFIASDQWWSKQVPDKPNQLNRSLNISDYTTYSMIGIGASAFLLGEMTNSDHMKEAGLLSGEAAINSTGVAYLFKEITQRQRPMEGNGNGDFFSGGASFPSEHSAIAWSIASVMAHEYPSPVAQFAAYSAATAVTITRVTARQHFPADVVVGSALGWYFGRQVYRKHHDPEVGGAAWGNWFDKTSESPTRNPNYMASPYVPLDSWIYPAIERLVALGYIRSNMLGIRPWTRIACARILDDARSEFSGANDERERAEKIYSALNVEFASELSRLDGSANVGASIDSVYTRSTGISGTPLRDSFNFGQTIVNDYGRPYWTGYNNVTGITAQAEAGPLAVNFQAEYQHSPAMPSYSQPTLSAVAAADFRPPLANGIGQMDQVKLLNSTVSLNINNVQLTFGEQSSWLGPGESSSFLMSDNAAPFPMLKIDDVVPHEIPGPLKVLGLFRSEFFIGQLSGHQWEFCSDPTCVSYPGYADVVGPNISPQPFIHGEKISFQPTPNFEFGMGFTATFGGPGLPVTFGNFFRTYYAHSSTATNNPGKRISQADFTYRIPRLRNWLTFYFDSFVTDEVSPIGSTRANVSPGLYMPRFPKLEKLELRAEGFNESRTQEFTPGFVYSDNRRYLDGYTNDGLLMGSWIGRAGRGGQGWLTYSFTPRNQIQWGYRLQTVDPAFIQGGRLVDYSAQGQFLLTHQVQLTGTLQYEQWHFPALNAASQSNIMASMGVVYFPHFRVHAGAP
jgi:membrane-associated phospholipid phosphatase